MVSFTQQTVCESIALGTERVNLERSSSSVISERLVANLEHFDRSRLNSVRLSHYDHDWSGVQRLGRTRGGFSGVKEGAVPLAASCAHLWSTIRTFTPARANPFAHMSPAGPAPTTRTSILDLVDMVRGEEDNSSESLVGSGRLMNLVVVILPFDASGVFLHAADAENVHTHPVIW